LNHGTNPDCFRDALSLSRQIGFSQSSCACQANLANLALIEENPRRALRCAQKSRHIALEICDKRSEAIAEENLALACVMMRNAEKARAHFARALRLAAKLHDVQRQVSVRLGCVEMRLSLAGGAVSRGTVRKLLQSIEDNGFMDLRPRALRILAETMALHPQYKQEATEWLKQAASEAERLSNSPEQIACRKCLDRWSQTGR